MKSGLGDWNESRKYNRNSGERKGKKRAKEEGGGKREKREKRGKEGDRGGGRTRERDGSDHEEVRRRRKATESPEFVLFAA